MHFPCMFSHFTLFTSTFAQYIWLHDLVVIFMCVFQPQPLAFLVEDIREVLKQETGADIFNRADIQPDYRAWKHNVCVACSSILEIYSLIVFEKKQILRDYHILKFD